MYLLCLTNNDEKLDRGARVWRRLGRFLQIWQAPPQGTRVRVYVNADEPLQFERRAGFANGDVIRVTLKYEDLHRHCFTCKRISHEEGTCPELSETQKEKNRLARIEQKVKEEKATREVFSFPSRYGHGSVRSPDRNRLPVKQYGRYEPRDHQGAYARRGERSPQDLRGRIIGRREAESKNVWNRLEKNSVSNDPRDRARYHPYHRGKEYDYSKREDERTRSRVLSGHSNWNNKDKMVQLSVHPLDSQSVSRYSPRRRTSPDSQRTLTVNYVGQRDRGFNRDLPRVSPLRDNREWRPVRQSQGGDKTSLGEVTESGEKEKEAERRRIEKGKGIAIEPPSNQERTSHGRGKLIIREPAINNNPERVQRSTGVVIAGQSETRVLEVSGRVQGGNVDDGIGKEKEQTKSTEGAETSAHVPEQGPEEDEEYMDDEAFEKMVEFYTDPDPGLDEEMLNVDDLMEEEQELERKEKERESLIKERELQQNTEGRETRGERGEEDRRGQQTRKAVGKRSPSVAATNLSRAGATVAGETNNRNQEGSLQREGKRKKVPKSPEIKDTTTLRERRAPRETRCQVDASWTQEGAKMGLGFVVLEGDRKCLMGLQNWTKAPSPLHAEAEGLVWAMKAMIRQGKRTMHFETDCAQLVSVIQNSEDWPAMASVVEDINIESLLFECFSIAYIPRGMNQRADCLAKAARARIEPLDCICVETPVWLAHVASLLE
ncbi:hypothetical protein IGI04_028094 [Brassica rapa subsp. trilocularis]|uniref:RNase H type-1 domain-containing protein n=1 Tax=Brassica rapa subsp. trilocularis TaxID=1813537 RepID=A0ABQ7L0Z2_BRACM|nr:hypothetical protein IGI04_028094 [Brassica rapa subsp. trilocularis]